MKYDPDKHHRRSVRLKDYDYSQPGAYFVTICAYQRQALFGEIVDGEICLSDLGKIVLKEWEMTLKFRPNMVPDEYVIMPNHFHAIIMLVDHRRGTARRAQQTTNDCVETKGTARRAPTVEKFSRPISDSIPTIVRSFKSAVTRGINELRKSPGAPVWQRNYHEHIIRNETDLTESRAYITNNTLAPQTTGEQR